MRDRRPASGMPPCPSPTCRRRATGSCGTGRTANRAGGRIADRDQLAAGVHDERRRQRSIHQAVHEGEPVHAQRKLIRVDFRLQRPGGRRFTLLIINAHRPSQRRELWLTRREPSRRTLDRARPGVDLERTRAAMMRASLRRVERQRCLRRRPRPLPETMDHSTSPRIEPTVAVEWVRAVEIDAECRACWKSPVRSRERTRPTPPRRASAESSKVEASRYASRASR